MFEQQLNTHKDPFPTIPDNGPGPQRLVRYDDVNDLGYFGTLLEADLFTFTEIDAAAKSPLGGAVANRNAANVWIKAYSKGKVIYMPKLILRTGTTWASIYKAGYMYGSDDNGSLQPGGVGVNQLTTLTKTALDGSVLTVKVRSIRAYNQLVYPTASLDTSKMPAEEYFGIRWRLGGVGGNTSTPPYWASLGTIGGLTLTCETQANGASALMVNNNSSYLYYNSWDINTNQYCSFYPVLEIVSIVKP